MAEGARVLMIWSLGRKRKSVGKISEANASKRPVPRCGILPSARLQARGISACVLERGHEDSCPSHTGRGLLGDGYVFATPRRCPSTPPPTKWKEQQCDQDEGHEGDHYFSDGFFTFHWSSEHMTWCGAGPDHIGHCWPADPAIQATPSEPDLLVYPEHEREDYSVEAAIDFTEPCGVVDEAHAVFCDRTHPHVGEWHSGTDGVHRWSWPFYKVDGHDYAADGTHNMWKCYACLNEEWQDHQRQLDALWVTDINVMDGYHREAERIKLPKLPEGWDWYSPKHGVAWDPATGEVSTTVASNPDVSGVLRAVDSLVRADEWGERPKMVDYTDQPQRCNRVLYHIGECFHGPWVEIGPECGKVIVKPSAGPQGETEPRKVILPGDLTTEESDALTALEIRVAHSAARAVRDPLDMDAWDILCGDVKRWQELHTQLTEKI